MSRPIACHSSRRPFFPSRPSRSGVLLLLLLAWLVSGAGCAGLEGIDLEGLLLGTGPLDEGTVATGLEQALQVGTGRTTSTLSEPGGFASDPKLRLRLPGELGQLDGLYTELVARYEAIPFATKRPSLDLEAYVTNRTLEGLFSRLATEEARIREDPGARTTALLRRVFGAREGGR